MWRRSVSEPGFGLRCLLAFAAFNLICWPLLPVYAGLLGPVFAGLWNGLEPHGQSLLLTEMTPRLRWTWTPLEAEGQTSFRLLTYNVVLYLTALSVVPGVPRPQRLRWLLAGMAALFLWHVADLMLSAESQLLTQTRPDSYDLGQRFDVWFLAVKFANNLSALGLRQVVPLLLLAAQWRWWRAAGQDDGGPAS